jgi:uncharacterized membrane protein
MHQLSQARTLGGVGALLMLLVWIPPLGWVLSLIGAVMVLFAIRYISEALQDRSIFNNMVIAIILEVAGLVVGVTVLVETVLSTIGLGIITGYYSSGIPGVSLPPGLLTGNLTGLIVGVVIIWITILVSAIFVRRSYDSVSKRLGVGMFGTVGLLYLIGAAFTIILVGFVLLLLALILNMIAFFSMTDQPIPQPVPQATTHSFIS